MNTKQAFELIDTGIDAFNADKGFNVSTKPNSDWLIFDWRQINWRLDSLEYIIEIYPQFEKEKIMSWTLYTAVWYDDSEYRHYHNKQITPGVELETISNNIVALLNEAYAYINGVKKVDIPKVVKLD